MTTDRIPLNEKFCLSLKEAIEYIGLGETSLKNAVERGELPVIKHTSIQRVRGGKAGRWLFKRTDLEAYINEAAAGYRG